MPGYKLRKSKGGGYGYKSLGKPCVLCSRPTMGERLYGIPVCKGCQKLPSDIINYRLSKVK